MNQTFSKAVSHSQQGQTSLVRVQYQTHWLNAALFNVTSPASVTVSETH